MSRFPAGLWKANQSSYERVSERAAVEAKLARYRRLWELVEELTEVNLAMLKQPQWRKRAEGAHESC